MSNIDIFQNNFFDLPKKQNHDDFLEFVSANLNIYLDSIEKFDWESKELEKKYKEDSKFLCDSIILAINYYLQGLVVKSYRTIEPALNKLLDNLYPPPRKRLIIVKSEPEIYFKLRYCKDKIFERKEIFHIPFESRHIVKSNRYSLPGIPCIYLSNSIDLCWQELRRPKISKLYVSKFEFNINNLRLFDLAITPQSKISFIKTIQKNENPTLISKNELEILLLKWPLAFICSIKKKRPTSNFIEQYIMPQLLMQWIQENDDFDGVKYFSTIADTLKYGQHHQSHTNLAIPIKSIEKEGICKNLTKKLKLTEPISLKRFVHLEKSQPKMTEFENWKGTCKDSFINTIIRTVNFKKKPFKLLEKIEMKIIKYEAKNIQN